MHIGVRFNRDFKLTVVVNVLFVICYTMVPCPGYSPASRPKISAEMAPAPHNSQRISRIANGWLIDEQLFIFMLNVIVSGGYTCYRLLHTNAANQYCGHSQIRLLSISTM